MVCPAGVKIAEMNARARAKIVEDGRVPLLLRLRNNLVARAALLGQVAQPLAPLANAVFQFRPARWLAEKTLHIHRAAPFPSFSRQRFTTWFRKRRRPAIPATRQVVYFHGCSTQYYEPRVGRAAVRVLEANGFEVIVPPQNCCGLPLLSNGEFPAARPGGVCPAGHPDRRHLHELHPHAQRRSARAAGYARRGHPPGRR
jgi:glycerol-3-phosphate dehydrogenase subunit C